METLTRLVSESLARHGFDRPLDYHRLQWSRWFHCESHRSLLSVPSRPGVFALAEEIVDFDPHGPEAESQKPEGDSTRRMLAVAQFFEADDMAFVLDRMLSFQNPMRARLNSGRYFVRYVVIEDPAQRRSICAALNQWIVSSAEKVTGIGAHFATSLELTEHNLSPKPSSATADVIINSKAAEPSGIKPLAANPQLDSGAAANIRCPSPFPSGF